jgi:hypothetical protein
MRLKVLPPEIMPRDGALVYWDTPLSGRYASILITKGSWSDRKFVVSIQCSDKAGHGDEWTCEFKDPVSVRVGEHVLEASWNARDCRLPDGTARAPFYEVRSSKEHAHYEAWIERIFPNDGDLREYLIASEQDEIRVLTNHAPEFRQV